MRRALAIIVMLGTFAGLWAYNRWQAEHTLIVHRLQGWTMGSTWQVNAVGPASLDPYPLKAAIEAELATLDQQLSGYRDTADLSRFNRAPVGQWHALPPHLAAVLTFGQALHRESAGAFDLSVKPLVNLWGFGAAEPRATLPTDAEIQAARARLGSSQLALDADPATAQRPRGMRRSDVGIDVDAIAPGYAADIISALLQQRGLPAHMVDIGGELRVRGLRPDGTRWRIGVEHPVPERGRIQQVIHVTDTGVATSGDYRDFVEIAGRRYSHTIDPATGQPVNHALASVTVLARSGMQADGYATVLMVLGPERGMRWADARGIGVFMLLRDGRGGYVERYNAAFAPVLARE